MKNETTAGLKDALLREAKADYERKLQEIDRKSNIIDAMPDAGADLVRMIHPHMSKLYGTVGAIDFDAVGLADVAELMQAYTPVPVYLWKQKGHCTVICPVSYTGRTVANYTVDPVAIAPFVVTVDGYPHIKMIVKWWAELAGDLLVECRATVYADKIPEYSHQGYVDRAMVTYLATFGTSYGQRICKSCSASLNVSPRPAQIKWAAGSQEYPNRFTFYWPGLTDLVVDDLQVLVLK